MTRVRTRWEERRDDALRDLLELDEQVAHGELDRETAEHLRARYEADAAFAMQALEGLEEPDADRESTPPRRNRAALAGAVALIAAVAAVLVLPGYVGQRPAGGFVTGNEQQDAGRDLSQVTNEELEAVVAANPDVVAMRVRLAHRYLEAGDDEKAFEHSMAVLDREENSEAMAHVGWLLYRSRQLDLAVQMLEAAFERAPEDVEVRLFLANVRLYGQDDPRAALSLLDGLADDAGLAGDAREQLNGLLREARRRAEAAS